MNPHEASLSRHPLAQLAVAFSAGICVANYFPARLIVWSIAGGVCTAVVVVAVVKRWMQVAGVFLVLGIGIAGATLANLESRHDRRSELQQFVGRQVIVTGVLANPPELGRDRFYLTLEVERVDVDGSTRSLSGVVSLLAPFRYEGFHLSYGTRVRVVTKLSPTDNYLNPGVLPLAEYLDRKGYDASGVIKNAAAITRLEDGPTLTPLSLLYWWREQLQHEIHSKFETETAGVLDAALLGNRYYLSRETSERFREGGTFHVLVISGLHITFIGGVVLLIVRRLTKRRLLHFVAPVVIVWAYSLAVGAEASVVRAALMFTFAGIALALFRDSTSLNALGGAALVLLVQSPKELFDPSLQLTFLSVLAIIAVAWPLLQACAAIGGWYPSRETPCPPSCSRGARWFCEVLFWSERRWKKEIARSPYHYRLFKPRCTVWLERYGLQACLRYIFAAIVVSGAVQLVLLPLMIVYFHRLSLASLLLNIVVGVLLAVLAVVALLALLVSQISTALAAPLFTLANTINWTMIHSVDPFTHFNLASIRVAEYSGWGAVVYVLYYVPLLSLRRRLLPLAVVQVMLVVILILHPFSAGVGNGRLRVDFLDVGQGDAALVTMPDGRTLLVDGGGNTNRSGSASATRSIGEAVVSEYLWWRGLDTVDYVLPTHADADHIDGLNDVVRNFTVDAALVARAPANDPEFAKFAQTLSAIGTQMVKIQEGDLIRFGDVVVEVLWPANDLSELSRNNDSTVLRVRFLERAILLTGDIEKSGERALVEGTTELKADVVKAPHHGSKSSSTLPFVAATKARVAVVSVGKNSVYGHPHREVVERWRASGALVLTTGECGTITVTTDGTQLTVMGMRSHSSQGFPCRVDQ